MLMLTRADVAYFKIVNVEFDDVDTARVDVAGVGIVNVDVVDTESPIMTLLK